MNSNPFNTMLAFGQILEPNGLMEMRMENTEQGYVVYVGQSSIPNCPTDESFWFIRKMYYDVNNYVIRIQLPDDGVGFKYSWDNRATYFS